MRFLPLAVVTLLAASPALAGEAWDELRPLVTEGREILPAGPVIRLDMPYRTANDLRTPLGATLTAPEGRMIRRITLVIDENPMPVSAVVSFAEPVAEFRFSADMRMNGPSPVHVLAETDDCTIYMAETMVKTSGTGACASAPVTDPALAASTLGNMELAVTAGTGSVDALAALSAQGGGTEVPQVRLDIRHPSNSGMQKDQVTLLYIPARYITELEVSSGGRPFFRIEGSISFSENPGFDFDLRPGARDVTVRMTDIDGTVAERAFSLTNG